MILLVLLFLLLWSVFIFFVLKDKRLLGFYFKGFTSFSFILVLAYSTYDYLINDSHISSLTPKVTHLIIALFVAMVAGLLGDLFLEMMHVDQTKDKVTIITFGTIIFMIGHLFYIAGLVSIAKFSFLSITVGAVMTAVVYFGGKMMKLKMGKLAIISYIYSFVIFTMIGQAIANAFYFDFSTFSLVFMIGAVFFGVSDLFLAPLYFGEEKRNSIVVVNLATYYLGQLLIALSIFFL